MRPKKHPSERKDTPFHMRLTEADRRQFYAQAKLRGMELAAYFRSLAKEEGEQYLKSGKIRRTTDGMWEVLIMGEWRSVHS